MKDTTEIEAETKSFFISVIALLLLTPQLLLAGFTLQCLWAWFVVPFGVTPLAFWHAVGLWIFRALINPMQPWRYEPEATTEVEKYRRAKERFSRSLGISLGMVFALGLGFFAHHMMKGSV